MSSSRVHAAITCSAPIAALTDPNPWAPAVAALLPGAHVISIVPRKQATPHMITMRLAGLNMRDVVEVMHKDARAALILARKPLESTVADSVKRWGTGAINVDATRIATSDVWSESTRGASDSIGTFKTHARTTQQHEQGRWPANLLLDDVAREALDAAEPKAGARAPVKGSEPSLAADGSTATNARARVAGAFHEDTGGASRFFARTADVLTFAVRLICPPGALVLDPFRDATSPIAPVVAAEGFTFVGGA